VVWVYSTAFDRIIKTSFHYIARFCVVVRYLLLVWYCVSVASVCPLVLMVEGMGILGTEITLNPSNVSPASISLEILMIEGMSILGDETSVKPS
jgi:hypothetical protein